MRNIIHRIQMSKQHEGHEDPNHPQVFLKNLLNKSGVLNDSTLAATALGIEDISEYLRLKDEIEGEFQWAGEHPLEILVSMRRNFRKYDNWPMWEQETLLKYTEEFMGRPITPVERIKILALQTALITDAPWQIFDVFENFCIAMGGDIPTVNEIEPLDLYQLGFGLGVLNSIRDENYSDQVRGYIAATLLNNGVVYLPGDIGIVDVNDIIRHMIQRNPIIDVLIENTKVEWRSGRRIKDPESDIPADQQVLKIDAIKTAYDEGSRWQS